MIRKAKERTFQKTKKNLQKFQLKNKKLPILVPKRWNFIQLDLSSIRRVVSEQKKQELQKSSASRKIHVISYTKKSQKKLQLFPTKKPKNRELCTILFNWWV